MKDGLYQIKTNYLCAGFYIENNELIYCAPILKKKFNYWKTIAKFIEEQKGIKCFLSLNKNYIGYY